MEKGDDLRMSKEVKAAVITGVLGLAATISAAIIGVKFGENTEQKSIQNEIKEVMGDVVNVIGDGNEVTINDIKELVENYQELQTKNDLLDAQNEKYFTELMEANEKLEEYQSQSDSKVQELETQLSSIPEFEFKNISLSIDGEDMPISSVDSSIVVNNKAYYSYEFIKGLVDANTSITVQDDTMYIGRIIKERMSLYDNQVISEEYIRYENIIEDSHETNHTDALAFTNKAYITYDLKKEYAFLKCTFSIEKNLAKDGTGTITIKADGKEVYSRPLSKYDDILEIKDIPINNCSMLTIEYATDDSIRGIVSDIEVYNF